jgi:TRAP-type C4-dicarboxylate transport system permease small subunit
VIGRLARSASTLAGVAVLAIVLLITYDVAMRFFFEQPQLFVDEVASFLELFVIFGGLAYTFRTGGHVRVDLLTGHLPGRARARLRVVGLVLGLVFLAIVIWTTAQSALTAYRYGRVSAVMLYPLWAPMALIPLGLALLAGVMLVAVSAQLRALHAGRHGELPPPETAE